MVPNSWKLGVLSELCEMQAGKFVKASDISSEQLNELFPCYGGNGLRGYTSTFTHDGTYSLIGRQGALCGNITFAQNKFHATEHAVVTTPKPEIDTRWLYYVLVDLNLNQYATGQAQPGLSVKNLINIPIRFPSAISEQRKIAKILSTWDKAITVTEKLIETSKQQKKALMQQLLTGKKRLVNPETGKAFEGEWEEVPLSNWLIEYKEKSSVQDQHRVYTSSRAGLVPQDEYFGNSRISDRKNIGFHVLPPEHMTYRSRSDDGFFTFNLFKGNENGIISHYYPVFTSKGSNDFFIALLEQYRTAFGKHSVGTSQKVLSFNALKAIRFSVPSTEEQQKIASVLTTADKETEVLETKLAHFKQEKKALMQQLLTGKRRVKVDEEVAA